MLRVKICSKMLVHADRKIIHVPKASKTTLKCKKKKTCIISPAASREVATRQVEPAYFEVAESLRQELEKF